MTEPAKPGELHSPRGIELVRCVGRHCVASYYSWRHACPNCSARNPHAPTSRKD